MNLQRPCSPATLPQQAGILRAWIYACLSAVMFLCQAASDASAQAVSAASIVYTFDGTSLNGYPKDGVIRGRDGNFYGVTPDGGTYGNGMIFRLTPAGEFTVLHSFTNYEGHAPTTGLIQASDGNFYGPAQSGNSNAASATVYRMTPSGEVSNVHLFAASTEGSSVKVPLVQGSDGNFYGATSTGGPSGNGTLFKLTPSGKVTVLHGLTSGEGGPPVCALTQGADGSFYGTNRSGLFKLTPGGEFTIANNTGVQGGLVLGQDGNLYGLSTAGNRGCGSVVRVTPAGDVTSIYNFYYADGYLSSTYYNSFFDGGYPINGPIVQGNDGYLYGTTAGGGTLGKGTVFRCTLDGELTVLHNFEGGKVGTPKFGTFVDGDGTVYALGASVQAQGNSDTLFKLTVSETHPPFFVAETPLANNVYYLNFTEKLFDNTHFGYYAYLADPNYLYHFDLGYEYLFDARDGQRGLYLYDFASQTFFYTSPVFPFPYLYDFSLNAVLYYYPDPQHPDRFNTNGVRYFYNYSTGKIITK